MTTFTTEDRQRAQKLVDEAPYHPGYEDAVITPAPHISEAKKAELEKFLTMHLNTSKKIVDFIKAKSFDRC